MSQELLERVLQSPRLPSLPSIAIEVIDLVQQKDVNIKQIANTIQHDPALSSKILKTVNSSFYGQAHSISTISHALVILGLNSVKTLALGFSLVVNLKDSGGENFDHVAFWKRSLYSAVAARSLATQVGLVQHEEAFLGGLLQDLGMMAIAQTMPRDYGLLLGKAGPEHRKLVELEREQLHLDHAQVGGALAEKWNLPPLLACPIRYHHDADAAPKDLLPLVRCVVLGGCAGDVFMSAAPGEALDRYYTFADRWFNLPREQAEPLLKTVHKNTLEMRRLFDLPTGELENPDQILARANEALQQISLQQERNASELEQRNRQLAEQATTDSLTGAANRRRFNEYLGQQFSLSVDGPPAAGGAAATTAGASGGTGGAASGAASGGSSGANSGGTPGGSSGGPMSLVFMDVDHFKKFNDTFGHQVGDRVLVEVASVLKGAVSDPAMVARYGGEEFAVVLPGMDRIVATRLAEQIRILVSQAVVETDDGKQINVTASFGVATAAGGCFTRPEQLVKAADQAVYAAKAAGRNCVRVFAPRVKPMPQPDTRVDANAA